MKLAENPSLALFALGVLLAVPGCDPDDGDALGGAASLGGSDDSAESNSGPPHDDDDDAADDDDDDDGSGEDVGGSTGGDSDGADAGDDEPAADTGGDATGTPSDDGPGSESDSGAEPPVLAWSLNQAAYNPSTGAYEFGHDSIPNIPIVDGPSDVDWDRWAMLHDGANYRLYFMREGTDDTLLQFAFNPATVSYEFGHDSIPELPIVGAPLDADLDSFAMLHDGTTYRLYAQSMSTPLRVHQFGYDANTQQYVYGHASIPEIPVVGTPPGADVVGWGMLHDGADFRLYTFANAEHDTLAQHGFSASTSSYVYGHNSIPQLSITGTPAGTHVDDFAMLHDGGAFRLYMLTAE